MKKYLCLLLLLCVTACASFNQQKGSPGPSSNNFAIEFPEKWTKLNIQHYLMFTRSGPFSQYILVQQRYVDKPFDHTKKKINRGMLPQEAAEVIGDEIISDRSILNFQVIENLPARVGGHDGFKMVFTYKTRDGLKFKTLYYGLLQGEWFYSLRLNAAEANYSDIDIETFKTVLKSFKLVDA